MTTPNTTFHAYELFAAMLNRTAILVCGQACLIQAIAMEDGSGKSFNVTLHPLKGGRNVVKYIRTV